ncbi:formate dehydrogenase subunit gamma [Ostreiculturibacter nitratireducens]|uniref:formate dehydrogenase subunit gamma n=1 Tax=Ostreiculturibacter nitratireducens TaxID=3075226 RepID=UPI0031B64AEC
MPSPRILSVRSLWAAARRIPVLLAVLGLLALSLPGAAQAQSSVRPPESATTSEVPLGPDFRGGVLGNRSDGEIWHDIRLGAEGTATIPDPNAATLIQSQGEDWRLLRLQWVIPYGGQVLLAVLGILAVFFVVRGRIKIKGGRSGRVIPRFSLVERVVHWFTAILFVLLGVSGLIILFGRPLLIPVIGADAFALLASASMQGHNLFGPLFILSIVALFVTFVRGNGYRWVDLKWAFKGGGLLGGHASSGRYNFGEKSWFWWATLCGIALSVSGILMLFPNHLPVFAEQVDPSVPPERALLQIATVVHAVAALAFIAFGMGHIYLGTIGMEGALEGMTRGTVDENWAKEHHDLWYEDHLAAASTDSVRAEVKAAAGDV